MVLSLIPGRSDGIPVAPVSHRGSHQNEEVDHLAGAAVFGLVQDVSELVGVQLRPIVLGPERRGFPGFPCVGQTTSHLEITAGAVSATIPTLPFWPDPSSPLPLHFQAIHATAMTASRRSNAAASLAATRVPLRRIAPLFMVHDLGGGGGVSIAAPISDAIEVLILPQYRPFAHILHSEEPLW